MPILWPEARLLRSRAGRFRRAGSFGAEYSEPYGAEAERSAPQSEFEGRTDVQLDQMTAMRSTIALSDHDVEALRVRRAD